MTGKPWIEFLETEDGRRDSWNIDDGGSGMPGVALFANALQVWSSAQGREVTVQEAAAAFNVHPEIIEQAVASHYWMFLSGDVIEHEGE